MMKFALFSAFLLLPQNASGQICEDMLRSFLEHRTDLEMAGAIANEMYDNGCWGAQTPRVASIDTCKELAEMIVDETRGRENPVLKISNLEKLDNPSRWKLIKEINRKLRGTGRSHRVQVNPPPGSTRVIECSGAAKFATGTWIVQIFFDRYEDGDGFWGINSLLLHR